MVSISCADLPIRRQWHGARPARLAAALFGLGSLGPACSSDTERRPPSAEAGSDAAPSRPEAGNDVRTRDATDPITLDAANADSGARAHVTPAPAGAPWDTLDEWHLFTDPLAQTPAERVVPYDVNAPLFADYAAKHRFIYVPEGARIGYDATATWRFPVGTILVKTFSYPADTRDPSRPERLLETRLMIRDSEGWATHTYVWDEQQLEARRKVAGAILDVAFIDPSGTEVTNRYLVPNENECRSCHGKTGETDTLGGRTRQLDRDRDYGNGPENQIDHLARLGLLDAQPEPIERRERLVDPFGTAPIFQRVRAYFDGNCAHCHQPGDSQGSLSGLWLDYPSTDPETQPAANWGVCKQPQSAGGATCARRVDIVPGDPDKSILICRMEATDSDVRMAPLGRTLAHAEGVALMREWIRGLPGSCVTQPPNPPSGDAGAAEGGPTESSTDATAGGSDATTTGSDAAAADGPGG